MNYNQLENYIKNHKSKTEDSTNKKVCLVLKLDDDLVEYIDYLRDGEVEFANRFVDDSRVEEIYKDQIEYRKKYGCFNFTGVISLGLNGKDSKCYVLDGQHRYSVIVKLYNDLHEGKNEVKYSENELKTFYHIFLCESMNEIYMQMKRLNNSVPVPINYVDKNSIVDAVIDKLYCEESADFDKSKGDRPKIITSKFKSALTEMYKNNTNIKNTFDYLYNELHKFNQYLSSCDINDFKTYKIYTTSDQINRISKMQKSPKIKKFYFGIFCDKKSKRGDVDRHIVMVDTFLKFLKNEFISK